MSWIWPKIDLDTSQAIHAIAPRSPVQLPPTKDIRLLVVGTTVDGENGDYYGTETTLS